MKLKTSQIALIVLSAVAVFLYWQKYQDVYKDEGRLQVSEVDGAVMLSWRSGVELPMTRRIEEAYSQWYDKTDKFIVNLDSPGGALREGRQVVELLDRMAQTHILETTVGDQASCLSMCVPIYLRGEIRSASRNSRWMFHEPSSYNYVTDEREETSDEDRRAAGERFFAKYFMNSEMDPQWREGLRNEWIGRDVWRTGQQLVNENSNIITRLY